MAFTYLIQPGDTLEGLAERFGVSPEALVAANHLIWREPLSPGRPLLVPELPGELAAGAFPGDGWVPREGWLADPEEGAPAGEAGGEAPRAVVMEHLWRIRLPFPNVAVAFVDHVLLALHAGPARPRAGQPVTMRLIALNVGPTPLVLRYPTTQRAEFVVTRDGEEVFRASRGRVYAPVIREVTLAPGQAEVAVERFVPERAGTYLLIAWNLALARARLRLTLVVA
jgi:LysM repeat protein